MGLFAPCLRVNRTEKCHQSCSSDFENPYRLFLLLFVSSCSLVDCRQTQSLCLHKELTKRTIGKPTYAFEARDYVVSSPVTAGSQVTAQALTPVTPPGLGARGHSLMLPPRNDILDGETRTPGRREKPDCVNPTPGYSIRETCIGKGTKLPNNDQTS